jgi:cardiolipin synthase
MWTLIVTYWPHVLAIVSTVIAAVAAAHAAMTKDEVRAAIGWVGVILLSPFIGAILYGVAGTNSRNIPASMQMGMPLPTGSAGASPR